MDCHGFYSSSSLAFVLEDIVLGFEELPYRYLELLLHFNTKFFYNDRLNNV